MAKKHKQAPTREQNVAQHEATDKSAEVSSNRKSAKSGRSVFSIIRNINVQRSLQLVVVAALYSPLSQLNLSPVYGAIPSAIYHRYGLIGCVLLAYALRGRLPPWTRRMVPVLCFWIPSIQFALFQFSSSLGPQFGPLITELLTYYPLLVLSMYIATELLEDVIGRDTGNPVAETAPSMGLFLLFTMIQRSAKTWLHTYVGRHMLLSRVGAQLSLATLYSLILPHSMFFPAFPSVLFNFIGNPHMPLQRTGDVVENTLALSNFTLLDRTESVTGYISVLQSLAEPPLRVLRCDHSLLGGDWILPDRPSKQTQRLVAEPIYAIFTMLEAVRLIDPPPKNPDGFSQPKALVIGLGIGTAPSALINHNINTTVLELDPAVHAYAVKYFNLPPAHNFYIGDAVGAVTASANNPNHHGRYQYILHDVFTGGAEPVSLFTQDFLHSLSTLLSDDGVIAINYAGDLSLPGTNMIYRTITSVFKSCRIFRENEPDSSADVDFTNLVFFCRKRVSDPSSSDAKLIFRKPVEADFLGSDARREYLMPKYEVLPEQFETQGEVLTTQNARLLERQQVKSAIGHWKVMRGVLPPEVWEAW
jgi:hypothetical protein